MIKIDVSKWLQSPEAPEGAFELSGGPLVQLFEMSLLLRTYESHLVKAVGLSKKEAAACIRSVIGAYRDDDTMDALAAAAGLHVELQPCAKKKKRKKAKKEEGNETDNS